MDLYQWASSTISVRQRFEAMAFACLPRRSGLTTTTSAVIGNQSPAIMGRVGCVSQRSSSRRQLTFSDAGQITSAGKGLGSKFMAPIAMTVLPKPISWANNTPPAAFCENFIRA